MITREVTINNKTGLHARPVSVLIDVANKFDAQIMLTHENKEANLKSIISVMSMAIGCGETVMIKAEGSDAKEAVDKIVEVIENKFGEE